MDRFEAMATLVAAIDAGSLSAAAGKLGTPLATVSRKVSDLEKQLGAQLLNRSSRRLTLTDAGRSYVTAARKILQDLTEAERAASGEYSAPKGSLSITAPIVFGRLHILPLVTEFLTAYPEIDVGLVLSDRLSNLWDDHIDLAVRIGELPDSSLIAARVGSVHKVVCASPSYIARFGQPQQPSDLAAHCCINCEGITPGGIWTFKAGATLEAIPIQSRLVVNTAEAAIDAGIAGLGIVAVLSYQVAAATHGGLLHVMLQEFEPSPSPVNILYARDGLLPLKTRAFIDFAVPRLKAELLQSAR